MRETRAAVQALSALSRLSRTVAFCRTSLARPSHVSSLRVGILSNLYLLRDRPSAYYAVSSGNVCNVVLLDAKRFVLNLAYVNRA